MDNKFILVIDAILILGSLFAVWYLVGYARPLAIAPLDDYTTSDNLVLFEFEKADLILIDDNLDFSSPREIYVQNDILITLEPGIYYWKVVGALESEVRQLTIESDVDLKIRESQDGNYEVVNAGNTELEVDVYNHGRLTGKVVLGVDESSDEEGDKFIGGENE
ncbi:MAG: hypothetical protein AABY16_02565 [Nanoarchaeota archaeon]